MVSEIKILASILKESLDKKASDILLSSDSYPSLKINWDIVFLEEYWIFTAHQFRNLVLNLMTKVQQEKFLKIMELDFSIALWEARFRVNAYMWSKGYSMVFRPISWDIPEFDALWIPWIIKKFAFKSSWLVLITWWVWTWKSTTMASLINVINKNFKKHIITIEDTIEFVYKNEQSLIDQREVWTSTLSYENGLKYALRQASDVIMLWEMRDLDTFRLALRAAETWNLVFATLHTSWAARTVARIIDMFPAWEKDQVKSQLSESLVWVVWQKLIKKADWKGRVASTEIMINTSSVANVIRKWDDHLLDWIIETSSKDWMLTMKKSLDILFEKGVISEQKYREELSALWNEIK